VKRGDFRTHFDDGTRLIRLLQKLKPQRKPSQRYTLSPTGSIQRRTTRSVALSFVKELGVKGHFDDRALIADAPNFDERIRLLKAIRRDLGTAAGR
jgi:hypothetical protein